jgi:glucose/arabinose dehydrogenase
MKRIAFGIITLLLLGACSATPTLARITPSQPAGIPDTPSPRRTLVLTPTETAPAPPTLEPTPAAFPPPAVNLRSIAVGLDRPVYLTHAGDGSGRLFLVEKPGTIRTVREGTLLPDPFLDIRSLVKSSGSEQGLLGLAFDPQYPANGRFFVDYIDLDGNTVVARYRVSPADPDRADPASGTAILRIDQPYANHNGGDLVFGPDGYLYVGAGDGGSEGDPLGNGQRLDTLLGKILRIDVRGDAYAVPADNPFLIRPDARPEIWAYGLRNPWRFSFDRATGDLYIGDVGQDEYEEVDVQPAGSAGGRNYGWNIMEGFHPYKGGSTEGLIPPAAEYEHASGNCSVTGGYVYRGGAIPSLEGIYLFGDYCTGQTWVLRRFPDGWRAAEWFGMRISISSFGEDENGELYVLDYRGGEAFLLESAG